MIAHRLYVVICLSILFGWFGAIVAPAGGQQPAGEPAAAAQQAQAAFDQAFQNYKDAIRQIEQLRTDYQTANAATRSRINAELTGHVAHAQALVNTMVDAAMQVYRVSPNADQQITNFLVAVVKQYVEGQVVATMPVQVNGDGQYERALPIIKLLVDGGAEDRHLLAWGFLCAFCANDYDLAGTYLGRAREAGALENPADITELERRVAVGLIVKFAPEVDEYRELWAKESAIRAAEAAADDLPRVKLTTTKGEITLELFENEAPQSVANFIELVKQGYYNGTPFHRVIAGFMVQGGAKTDDGGGGPGYSIRGEHVLRNFRHHFRGSLSMARKPGMPDSGNSQFFLTMVPTSHLDGEHTVFGRVTDGIEVLADIVRREPKADDLQYNAALPKPDRILKAEVLRDRGHEYTFDRLPE